MMTWFCAPNARGAKLLLIQFAGASVSLCCKTQPVAGAGHAMTAVLVAVIWICRNMGCKTSSVTYTVKVFVAFNGGWPSSVTTVVKRVVLAAFAAASGHRVTPFEAIAAPAGG